MKIAFVCTSLHPGRDGVGDYVRRLAHACAEAGHVCLLISLHERQLPSTLPVERDGELRLPSSLSWSQRAGHVERALREFEPDWVSWQLVPYGFHAKGILPLGAFSLHRAARGRRNHVMLHELWIGLARGDNLRARLIGAWQRRRLLAFVAGLRPAWLHTSNSAYRAALAREHVPTELLPIFGNIPVDTTPPESARASLDALLGRARPDGPFWVAAIFGTVHPQWRPRSTLAFLRRAGELAQRRVVVLALGHPGSRGAHTLSRLAVDQWDIPVVAAGPQPAEVISHALQAADFAIATHPWKLIGKSGTTATLLEHGLPVLVPRDDWQLRNIDHPGGLAHPLLRRPVDLTPAAFGEWVQQRTQPCSQLPVVAGQFLSALGEPLAHAARAVRVVRVA